MKKGLECSHHIGRLTIRWAMRRSVTSNEFDVCNHSTKMERKRSGPYRYSTAMPRIICSLECRISQVNSCSNFRASLRHGPTSFQCWSTCRVEAAISDNRKWGSDDGCNWNPTPHLPGYPNQRYSRCLQRHKTFKAVKEMAMEGQKCSQERL